MFHWWKDYSCLILVMKWWNCPLHCGYSRLAWCLPLPPRIASMMLILPTLVAALVLPASAQIFRLPDADACEKSKTPDGMIFNSFSFQHLILATMYFEKVWLAGVIHAERFGKRYHFSWLEAGPNTKWDWEGARNYCRKFCMDSIAINSVAESKWVKNLIRWKISSVKFLTKSIRSEELHYIWTGGRKCNFKGCDRKDLQPAIQNGW